MALTENLPRRVLLVDGSAQSATPLADLFSDARLRITLDVVPCLRRALEAVQSRKPDVILLDLELPDSQGFQTFARLTAAVPGVPVIVLAAGEDDALEHRLMQHGAQDYVVRARAEARTLIGAIQHAVDRTIAARADRTLTLERERAAQYLDVAEVILLALDLDERVTMINRKGCDVLGYGEGELLGRAWTDICLPARIRETLQEKFRRIQRTGLTPDLAVIENLVLTKSGEERLISWRNTILTDAQGAMVGTLSSGEDITQRKHSEQQLQRLNRMYAVKSGVNQAIAREPDTHAMLTAACRIAVENGDLRMAWIGLRAPNADLVTPVASAGPVDGYLDEAILGVGDPDRAGPSARSLLSASPVVCNDVAADHRFARWRELALRRDYRSVASFPLTSGADVVGTLNLYAAEPNVFDDAEVQLLTELARDISFGLEVHARAAERASMERVLREQGVRLRQTLLQLQAVSTRVNVIREQERATIARDVHDHLGQALTALKMDVAEVGRRAASADTAGIHQRLAEMSAMIDAAVDDVRRVATALRPVMLDDLGIIGAIRAYLSDVERRGGPHCTLTTDVPELEIRDDLATALFRILQEAVTNVVRHASARRVHVSVRADAQSVRLSVHDDGIGIPAIDRHNPAALGLRGMRDRAILFGGDVIVAGGPGRGTEVLATLPLAALQDAE